MKESPVPLIGEETVKKPLDERDYILLQLELESDEEFLKDVERARKGKDVVNHDELKKEFGLQPLSGG